MAVTEYIGPLVGPVFANPAEWTSTRSYEALTIVLNEGNSYTARQDVPVGVPLTNENYWLETGNYNAQLEQYRQIVLRLQSNLMPTFGTVADMRQGKLQVNDICRTLGFNTAGDNGGAIYSITAYTNTNNRDSIFLDNGLQANLIAYEKLTPEMFGAVGDGTTDDTEAFNQMFIYGSEHSTYNADYMYSMPYELRPTKYLATRKITIPTQRNFILKGNNAVLEGFSFDISSFAFAFDVENTTFYECNNAFSFSGEVEYTNITFYKCRFRKCETPLNFNRQSSMSKIDSCQFMSFNTTQIYMNNADGFVIDNCWFEPDTTQFNDSNIHAVVVQEGDKEGALKVLNSFFIPQWHGNTLCVWFDISCLLEAHLNRISGESPGVMAFCHTNQNITNFANTSGHRAIIDLSKNTQLMENAIVLYGIPDEIIMNDNASIKNVTRKLIRWDDNIPEETKKSNLSAKADRFRLYISGNSNTYFNRHGNHVSIPATIMPAIPDELIPFINRGWHKSHGELGIASYSEKQNTYGLYTSADIGIYNVNNYFSNAGLLIKCHSWNIGSNTATTHIYLYYIEGHDKNNFTPKLIEITNPTAEYEAARFTVTTNGNDIGTQMSLNDWPTYDNPLNIHIKTKAGTDVTNLEIMPVPQGIGIGQC